MNVKIKELPESLALTDSDVFPVDKSSNITSKVSINTFKQYVMDYLTKYSADENAITLDEATNTFSVKNVFLPLSGGTMTGYISLYGTPTEPTHPVSKSYVDTLIGTSNSNGSLTYVKLAGDTMTGPLRVQSTIASTGKLSSAGGLDVTGDVYVAGKLTTTQSISTGSSLNVSSTLDVVGQSTFNNTVEFSNNKIQHFSANIKTISLGSTPPSNEYTLTLDDNGAILAVSGTGSVCKVLCPAGLPVGFNAMVIQNSSANVYVLGVGSTSTVKQIDEHYSIRKQYGMCNIVSISASLFIIAGDLS